MVVELREHLEGGDPVKLVFAALNTKMATELGMPSNSWLGMGPSRLFTDMPTKKTWEVLT